MIFMHSLQASQDGIVFTAGELRQVISREWICTKFGINYKRILPHKRINMLRPSFCFNQGQSNNLKCQTVVAHRRKGEVFLAEFFYEKNFLVPRFNALSTLLTACLNQVTNRQEDNTSEKRFIKKQEIIKHENHKKFTETCDLTDSRATFFTRTMGSQSDVAITRLSLLGKSCKHSPSWQGISIFSKIGLHRPPHMVIIDHSQLFTIFHSTPAFNSPS